MQMAQQMAAAGGDGVDPSIQLMLDLMRQDREQEEAQQNAEALVDGDGDGEGGVDPDAMTYEQLLALGEQIGDVGEERWRVEGVATVAALEHLGEHALGDVDLREYVAVEDRLGFVDTQVRERLHQARALVDAVVEEHVDVAPALPCLLEGGVDRGAVHQVEADR